MLPQGHVLQFRKTGGCDEIPVPHFGKRLLWRFPRCPTGRPQTTAAFGSRTVILAAQTTRGTPRRHPDSRDARALAGDEMSAQIKEVLNVSTTAKTTLALVGHLHISDKIEDLDRGGGNKIIQVFTKSFTENEESWRRIRLTESNVWISRVDDPKTAQRVVDIVPSEGSS